MRGAKNASTTSSSSWFVDDHPWQSQEQLKPQEVNNTREAVPADGGGRVLDGRPVPYGPSTHPPAPWTMEGRLFSPSARLPGKDRGCSAVTPPTGPWWVRMGDRRRGPQGSPAPCPPHLPPRPPRSVAVWLWGASSRRPDPGCCRPCLTTHTSAPRSAPQGVRTFSRGLFDLHAAARENIRPCLFRFFMRNSEGREGTAEIHARFVLPLFPPSARRPRVPASSFEGGVADSLPRQLSSTACLIHSLVLPSATSRQPGQQRHHSNCRALFSGCTLCCGSANRNSTPADRAIDRVPVARDHRLLSISGSLMLSQNQESRGPLQP